MAAALADGRGNSWPLPFRSRSSAFHRQRINRRGDYYGICTFRRHKTSRWIFEIDDARQGSQPSTTPQHSETLRFTGTPSSTQRTVRIGGAPVIHLVPARAAAMIEFEFADAVDVIGAEAEGGRPAWAHSFYKDGAEVSRNNYLRDARFRYQPSTNTPASGLTWAGRPLHARLHMSSDVLRCPVRKNRMGSS